MSATQELPAPTPRALSSVMREQFNCPGCESSIRPEHIKRQDVKVKPAHMPRHKVTAYCRCCNRAFFVVREMTFGGMGYDAVQFGELTGDALAKFRQSVEFDVIQA